MVESETQAPVLVVPHFRMSTVFLNRPRVINSLTLEMVRLLRLGLKEAQADPRVQFVLLTGAGNRGYCAGGDLKVLAANVRAGRCDLTERFLQEEYEVDLMVHRFPKPVIVLAHGITMGGGLGLAAGADIVVAGEDTRIAMPETRIGFFPDVGATGWLFARCPPGYPEYLGLTGYELEGAECVRLGLATCLTRDARLPELRHMLESFTGTLPGDRPAATQQLTGILEPWLEKNIPAHPELDAWVARHFAGKAGLKEIMASLSQCSLDDRWCQEVYQRLAERSPTALALTLKLLRLNEGRPLAEVFESEFRAGSWMIRQPDYLEGIRARLIDKDDRPRWQPASLEEVEGMEMDFGGGPGASGAGGDACATGPPPKPPAQPA